MATLEDAELAREQQADDLRELGAHAISVELAPEEVPPRPNLGHSRSRRPHRESYAVVAWFAGEPPELPDAVEVTRSGRKAKVPLRVRQEPVFQPE